jgi:hypothetical protein
MANSPSREIVVPANAGATAERASKRNGGNPEHSTNGWNKFDF